MGSNQTGLKQIHSQEDRKKWRKLADWMFSVLGLLTFTTDMEESHAGGSGTICTL